MRMDNYFSVFNIINLWLKNKSKSVLLMAILFNQIIGMQSQASPADLDNDGIPNRIEREVLLDPEDPTDALLDSDNDGWTNIDEYRLGTAIDISSESPEFLEGINHQKAFASDGDHTHYFGTQVAIDGNTAAIARLNSSDPETSADIYIFNKIDNLWQEQTKITAGSGTGFTSLRPRVALSGDTLAIGDYLDSRNGFFAGSVYIYVRSNGVWQEQATLLADDADALDYFGFSLTLENDTLVVGATLDDDRGTNAGSAYVFTRANNSWTQTSKLVASDGSFASQFGYAMDLQGII